jgi:hypothetical protein
MPADVAFDPMALYDFGAEDLDPNITYCIEAQEIFEIGTHRGQPYTGGHIEAIAENFKRFYFTDPIPLLVPPAVIGHEEDQEVLKRSDLPAGGWVTRCWVDGTKLKVNIGEIPALVMYWIKTGRIRTVSAEIYTDSGDAGLPPGHGPTLRRIALLGGDIPQVKTLSRLKVPVPEKAGAASRFSDNIRVFSITPLDSGVAYFAEEPAGNDADEEPVTNSEVRKMKHPKLFDEMKKDGIDDETVGKMAELFGEMPPDMLQKMSNCMKRYADTMAPPTGDFDRAAAIEMIASKNGIDRAMLEAKTDDELKALMGPDPAQQQQQMSDKAEDPTKLAAGTSIAEDARTVDTTGSGGNTAQAEAVKQAPMGKPAGDDVTKYSDNPHITRRLAQLQARVDEQERRERLKALMAKQDKVKKFCEQAVRDGKVTPAELNSGLKDLLMSSDDTKALKFSDGSTMTALDKQIDLISKRAKLNIFSEKMPASKDERAALDSEADRLLAKTEAGRRVLAKQKS